MLFSKLKSLICIFTLILLSLQIIKDFLILLLIQKMIEERLNTEIEIPQDLTNKLIDFPSLENLESV